MAWAVLVINPRFAFLWLAEMAIAFAESLTMIGLGYWALTGAHSIWVLAVLTAARVLVSLVVPPAFRRVVRRAAPRRLRAVLLWAQAALAAGLAFSLLSEQPQLFWVLTLAVASSVTSCLQGMVPVPPVRALASEQQQTPAEALMRCSDRWAPIAAPMLAGLVLSVYAVDGALLTGVCVSVIAAVFVSLVPWGGGDTSTEEMAQANGMTLLEAGRVVAAQPGMMALVIMSVTLSMVGAAQGVLLLALGVQQWHVGGAGYGFLEAAFPLGMLIVSLLSPFVIPSKGRGSVTCGAYAVVGLVGVLLPYLRDFVWASPLVLLDMVASGIGIVCVGRLLRCVEVPGFWPLYVQVMTWTVVAGSLVAGAAAESFGVLVAASGAGGLFLVGSVLAWLPRHGVRMLQ